MAVVIGEVIVEVLDQPTPPSESHPSPQQTPLSTAEKELVKTLALIQERKERLQFD